MVTRPSTETDGQVVIKDIHLLLMSSNYQIKGKADEETVWLTPKEAALRLLPQEAEFLKKSELSQPETSIKRRKENS